MRRLFNLAERRSFCATIGSLVIFALQEGSSSSLRLQLAAEALCREALERLAPVLCMRVTGEQLMAEGVEGGSREGAMLLLGPADEGAHLSFPRVALLELDD